jgi:DNA polymerase III epsilon subunit-like protein
MRITPYISLDLETTGLVHENPQILQIGAVFNTFEKDKLPNVFNVIVDNGNELHGNPYALSMNKWILDMILNSRKGISTKISVISLEIAKIAWTQWLEFCQEKTGQKHLTVAGKNVAGFDIPILSQNGFDVSKFRHRVIDPGSMYFTDFGYVPSLDEIAKLLNLQEVSHNALDDAFMVDRAISHKLQGIKHED